MELIDKFQTSCWKTGDPNPSGFSTFRIAHIKILDAAKGEYEYAVYNEEGDLKKVVVKGAGKRDPLRGVGNVEMTLGEDGRLVTGINLLDETVLYTAS